MPGILRNRVKVVVNDLELVAVDFCHRGRRNVLSVGSGEVAVECGLIEIAVFGFVEHRVAFVERTGDTAMVAVVLEVAAALAVFWHEFDALLVHVVVTVVALQSLLEQPAQQLLTALTHGRPRVRVNLEGVRNFYANDLATPVRGRTICAGVRNLLNGAREKGGSIKKLWRMESFSRDGICDKVWLFQPPTAQQRIKTRSRVLGKSFYLLRQRITKNDKTRRKFVN